ncbi:hypothetical protein LCGC14_0805650 [marine sediment metagenome]|uniref:Uncharacterized protein n=1 Tax=marine sediment metagenome TaxID=412755 RepID=A0A0F9S894_9ZZZZ
MPNKFKRIDKENRPENRSFMNIMVGKYFSVSYTMDITDPHYTQIEYMSNTNLVNIWVEGKHTALTEEEIVSEILTSEEIIGMLEHVYEKGKNYGKNLTINSMEKFVLKNNQF